MNYISNLAEHEMDTCSVRAGVPDDNRVVTLYDAVDGKVHCASVRYCKGKWIGEATGQNLEDFHPLSEIAFWCESELFLPSSVGTISNMELA